MIYAIEIIIIMFIATAIAWWWRMHGIHEYALKCINKHCEKLNIKLLDDYVALKKSPLNVM